ncbi:MAG: glycosyltransferase family 2 protein [bacterium]|nr:glycosyltransferase family 2 protein [bacterium]
MKTEGRDYNNSKHKTQNTKPIPSNFSPQHPTPNHQSLISNHKKTCIIIPCYNEQESIIELIKEIHHTLPNCKIIVIDDCSTDNSVSLLRKNGIADVLSLPVNLGIGGAVQTGIRYAKNKNYQYLVRLDGDGQHPIEYINDLVKPIYNNEADITIGSRFLKQDASGFKSTLTRRIGILFFTLLNDIIINRKITDSTSGFRSYNRELIEFLAVNYPSFDYPEPEEVILLGKNGFRIKELSVEMLGRTGGTSSINTFKAVYYMLKVTFAVFMVAVRPKIRD